MDDLQTIYILNHNATHQVSLIMQWESIIEDRI